MKKSTSITIAELKGRKSPFRVRYYENGIRHAMDFQTRLQAEAFKRTMETSTTLPADLNITAREMISFAQLREVCDACEISLEDGINEAKLYLIKQHKKSKGGAPLRDALRAYLLQYQRSNCRPHTMENYTFYCNWAEKYFGSDRPVESISEDEINTMIKKRNSQSVREHFVAGMRGVFKFLRANGIVSKDFNVEKINTLKVKKDETSPVILSVEEAKRLFAEIPKDKPSAMAYFALAAFTGLRPEEICSRSKTDVLQWKNIDMVGRKIIVEGATTKGRKNRTLSICLPNNLWAFLELTPPEERTGNVCKLSFNQIRRIRRSLSVKLEHDVLRHSFASYAFMMYRAQDVISEMGHLSSFKTFAKHYHSMTTQKEATDYFSILP